MLIAKPWDDPDSINAVLALSKVSDLDQLDPAEAELLTTLGVLIPSVDEFFEYWNSKGFLKVKKVTDRRRMLLCRRMKDPYFRQNWRRAIDEAAKSDFLLGDNDRGWTADIEWFLRPDTYVKVLEGKYGRDSDEYIR